MRFSIITIFPDMVDAFIKEGVVGRAVNKKKILDINILNPRDFTSDKHKTVDERPFGGGPGMVLKATPILSSVEAALRSTKHEARNPKQIQNSKTQSKEIKTGNLGQKTGILIMSPRGKRFDDRMASNLAKKYNDIILIAGRYEGIDARVRKALKDFSQVKSRKLKDKSKITVEEVSVGDYTLSGGELPAMTIVDAVSRKIPGVLGKEESLEESRVASGEVYTRPEILEWNGKNYKTPKVLLSGNHAEIEKWRQKKK